MSDLPTNPVGDPPSPLDLFPEDPQVETPKPVEATPPPSPELTTVPPIVAEPVKAIPPAPAIEELKETGRFGKIVRQILRILAFSLLLFTIGALALYIVKFIPTNRELKKTQEQLATISASLEAKTAEYADLKIQYDELLGNATRIEARASLSMALRSLELANRGIAQKNNVVVRSNLQMTRKYVDELVVYLQSTGQPAQGIDLADLMKDAEVELVRDPQAVGPAVQALLEALESLNEVLAQQ